jgi:hypothetical protein
MIRVKESNDIETQISLKPNDIHVGTVKHFDNLGIREDFIQTLELAPPGPECIDDPVLVACADLHKRDHADVRAVVVVFQINCYLFGGLELSQHGCQCFRGIDKGCSGTLERLVGFRSDALIHGAGVLVGIDLGLVGMWISVAVSAASSRP